MQIKPGIHTRAFGLLEVLIFIAILCGIVLYVLPNIRKLQTETKTARRDFVICQLENAKNKYDQDSKSADKKKFDTLSDEERFGRLAPILGASDPVVFVLGSGINRLKINKLGYDVEVD